MCAPRPAQRLEHLGVRRRIVNSRIAPTVGAIAEQFEMTHFKCNQLRTVLEYQPQCKSIADELT